MCLPKAPKMPAVQDPVKPQEAKAPDPGSFGSTSDARKRMAGPAAASTLLTGPSGVENSQLQLGRSTLLGQ